jgi:hypothetical protein
VPHVSSDSERAGSSCNVVFKAQFLVNQGDSAQGRAVVSAKPLTFLCTQLSVKNEECVCSLCRSAPLMPEVCSASTKPSLSDTRLFS